MQPEKNIKRQDYREFQKSVSQTNRFAVKAKEIQFRGEGIESNINEAWNKVSQEEI